MSAICTEEENALRDMQKSAYRALILIRAYSLNH
jgi:hypothetical protein